MTDKVQKIREEVERLRNLHQIKYQNLDTNDNMCLVECGKRNLCNELLLFIDSLQEEPVSDDLEAEIEDYMNRNFSEGSDGCLISDKNKVLGGVTYLDITYIARHFAKWKKLQIIKDSINGEVFDNYDKDICQHHLELLVDIPKQYKDGDKVKLIIIKED